MIDPVTALAVSLGYGVYRLINARAEAEVLRARAELIQASAQLPAGAEVTGIAAGGVVWQVRMPTRGELLDEH